MNSIEVIGKMVDDANVNASVLLAPLSNISAIDMEKSNGFKINAKMIEKMLKGVLYGDLIMLLRNQCEPYEVNKGETNKLVEFWIDKLCSEFDDKKNLK